MVDGPTLVEDQDKTAENKAIVQAFVADALPMNRTVEVEFNSANLTCCGIIHRRELLALGWANFKR